MALVHAELTATCNSLGCAGSDKYCIDPQCSEAVRDLIKFLRRDGDDHEIRRFLGAANIVETDLLPILVEYSDKLELFDLIIRLLVNLTTPALLIYNEQPPAEKQPRQHYLQMILHLQKYKRAFTDVMIWKIITDKLAEVIQAEYHEKGQEKVLSTVRLLILVRNILHVPADNDSECRPDNDANLHDRVLWAMHQSRLIDIIMYIAVSDNEQQYYLHALEIISLMLRDQNAAELANASVNRSETEKQRDEHELKAVLEKEQKEKIEKLKKYNASRHSKFGGRFVVSGMKSIGENEMVVSSMTSNINKAFDRYKKPLKTPRNRMPLKDSSVERKSAFSVRLFLKEFCVEFLHGAYNTLMKYVREMLVRSKSQPNDESYYFWAMQFFMEFNRNYKFEIKLVSETMALNIFHFVQERIEESREKLLTDKKKIPIWSKRMHLGLKAYKELMETLVVMYQSKDSTLQSSARTILTNLFYMAEYRDFLLSLLGFYDEVKFSRMYLKDLIETNHVFMKLLENIGKKQRNLVVLCKPKNRTTSKKSKPAAPQVEAIDDDTMWANLTSDLLEIIQENELVINANESRPYDPISETSMDDQKAEAMCRIRMHMRTKHLEDSVKLLRASREVWPEDGYFGNPRLSSNDELEILKQIFYADLGAPSGYNENEHDENKENEDEDEDEGEESSQIRMEEANFEFIDFVKKFAKPKVLQSCCQLLKEFDKNSTYTNHAVVKLLHRITFDCKFSALMFQASVFRVFQKIFLSKNPNHKELHHFAIYIMRKFTDVAKKNNKVFVELLFWKELKTAFEIEEGYDTDQKKVTTNWNEEQEDELHRLHEEYLRNMPEEDEATWICQNLIRQDRSRISVVKKMKQLGINPMKNKNKPNREFSEAEIVQITQLVHEFRESSNPIGFIMERLNVKRSKKHIIDKIVELGLVGDRKELRKKRSKNVNQSTQNHGSSDESNESDDDDDDDDRVDSVYHSLTSVFVLNAVKKVLDKDMKPALLWLIESLDDAAEDLDVDESDVPLLPLSDECMTAVNDTDFQNAMQILGIHKPSGIQETYWRIPGRWQANDIRQRSATIASIIDGTFIADTNTNTAASRVDESSDEEIGSTFDKIRKFFVPNNNNDTEKTNASTVNKTSDDKRNIRLNKSAVVQNKRKFVLNDSDTEEEVTPVKKKVSLNDSDEDDNIQTSTVSKRKKIIFLDDSDEEVAPIESKSVSLNNSCKEVEFSIEPKPLLLDDSNEEVSNSSDEEVAPVESESILVDDSDEEVAPIASKSISMKNSDKEIAPVELESILVDDSDEEVAPIASKSTLLKNSNKEVVPKNNTIILIDSDDENDCTKNNYSVKINKNLESTDEDEFIPIKKNKVLKKTKTAWLEDTSDEEDFTLVESSKESNFSSSETNKNDKDGNKKDCVVNALKKVFSTSDEDGGLNKSTRSFKRKISILENSDGEDDASVSSETSVTLNGNSKSNFEDDISYIQEKIAQGHSGKDVADELKNMKIALVSSQSLFEDYDIDSDCDTLIIDNN